MTAGNRSRRASLFLLCALFPFVGRVCAAQIATEPSQVPPVVGPNSGAPTTRDIVGKVTDKEGKVVPGAIVLLKDMKSLQVRSFIALKDGTYHFYGLSLDSPYEVRAQSNGMTSSTKLVSVFDTHKIIKVNLKLKEKKKKKDYA